MLFSSITIRFGNNGENNSGWHYGTARYNVGTLCSYGDDLTICVHVAPSFQTWRVLVRVPGGGGRRHWRQGRMTTVKTITLGWSSPTLIYVADVSGKCLWKSKVIFEKAGSTGYTDKFPSWTNPLPMAESFIFNCLSGREFVRDSKLFVTEILRFWWFSKPQRVLVNGTFCRYIKVLSIICFFSNNNW